MAISLDIIIANGGIQKKYRKGDIIFSEGEQCNYYHQIVQGSIKMFNFNQDEKEFTQGIFSAGESFGEPPLFINLPYPASAEATSDTTIIRLAKQNFLGLMDAYPDLCKQMLNLLANRTYSKSITTRIIINSSPEVRILSFLDYYKLKYGTHEEKELIPLKRQEIANHTALRVETVIRTLRQLKEEGKVEILNRKLFY